MQAGLFIKENTAQNETAFLIVGEASPQTVFYAGRNIKTVKDKAEAVAFLENVKMHKGVLYSAGNNSVQIAERFEIVNPK
jgi:hypothetical protein